MLMESSSYKKALYAWRDPQTGLNLLQLAVICQVCIHTVLVDKTEGCERGVICWSWSLSIKNLSSKKALYAWRDPQTGLNLLQLAVICQVCIHIVLVN